MNITETTTKLKLLEYYSLYTPDLAACDFVLQTYVKMKMKRRLLASDDRINDDWINECAVIPIKIW